MIREEILLALYALRKLLGFLGVVFNAYNFSFVVD